MHVCVCVCVSVKILEIQGYSPGTVGLGGPEGHCGAHPLGQMLEKFSFQALPCLQPWDSVPQRRASRGSHMGALTGNPSAYLNLSFPICKGDALPPEPAVLQL